ncbi:MAG: FtsQ-type POTRA domain-containing protein [Candidatus Hydrogenedentes bacterium]|nr:FtsQ-type POTRA domain-containing protein [Candidatus Hydrogenedentota bacterium]
MSILGAAAYGLHRYLYRSEDFLVKTIRVEGTRGIDPKDIVKTAGITTADSIMRIDVERVEETLVRTIPYVKSCSVTRCFPDTVIISVEERTATATLLVDGHAFEIDPDGVALQELPSNAVHEGPYISNVPDLGVVQIGDHLTQPALAAALEVWSAFSKMSISREVTVSELSAVSPNEIRMYCDELPYEVRWGRREFDAEAARFDLLWRTKNKQLGCAEYLDLRFGEDLACK